MKLQARARIHCIHTVVSSHSLSEPPRHPRSPSAKDSNPSMEVFLTPPALECHPQLRLVGRTPLDRLAQEQIQYQVRFHCWAGCTLGLESATSGLSCPFCTFSSSMVCILNQCLSNNLHNKCFLLLIIVHKTTSVMCLVLSLIVAASPWTHSHLVLQKSG